ncbi:FHA domain-containing protein [Halobacteriovorax sp. JY17]|uniref:FHA domain-containing protein n=1 Tax=Halobacteriovorax sp. JY17 TaxID=2014617 RepID=UPI000C43A353|nr:FHA domain-containing protein [Halobacteriovorax sp. JY17]PIK16137.1 MAG: hypothetical protein CES88_05230 [Halobacteriovorax sp. JY17]
MSNQINYELDIRFPDQSPHRVSIINKLSLGSSDKSELCIEDYNLSPLHLSFRTHNGVLSLHNLGGQNKTYLGKQELIHGKMYILNIGDELKLGDIEIFIREGDAPNETPDELKGLFEEKTDPVHQVVQEELIEYEDGDVQDEEIEAQTTPSFQSIDDLAEDDEEEFEDDESTSESEGTLVQKLTNIFKVKKIDVKKDIVSKNKNKSIPRVPPGFFTRFFSFLSLIAISYSIVDQVFPIFEVNAHIGKYIADFQKIITPIPYSNILSAQIIQIILVFILIELSTTLLFGVNIAYLLLGVRGDSGAIASRIKGVLRSIFSLATTPLLIFDLPCIVKKRTLKEVLSGSRLHTPSKFLQTLGILILFPILLLSPLYTPVLLNLDKFQAREVFEQQETRPSKKAELVENEWSNASLNLYFKGKTSKDTLIFSAIKNQKEKTKASLKFINKKNLNSWTNVSYEGEVEILNKILPLIKLNPMFSIHYPDLQTELESEKPIDLFTINAFDQLFQLVKNSLNLDPENAQSIFLNHGVFLQDLMGLNGILLENLSVNNSSSLSLFKNQDRIIISNTIQSPSSIRTEYLIIFRSGNTLNYRSSAPKKYARLTTKIIENFFQQIKVFSLIKKNESYDWSTTLDLLTSITETKKDLTDKELAKSYEYYFEFTRTYLTLLQSLPVEERGPFKKSLTSEISNIQEYLESTLEFNNFIKVSELNNSLKRLKENLESENLNFFSINQ